MSFNIESERLGYLRDCYGMCATHINTMFNYYLVGAALVGNAYVQALNPQWKLGKELPAGIAFVGLVLSLIFVLIHVRSRQMIDTIEEDLKLEEATLFPQGRGLLTKLARPRFLRHKLLFPAAYLLFLFSFAAMGGYALCGPALA